MVLTYLKLRDYLRDSEFFTKDSHHNGVYIYEVIREKSLIPGSEPEHSRGTYFLRLHTYRATYSVAYKCNKRTVSSKFEYLFDSANEEFKKELIYNMELFQELEEVGY